MGIKDSEGRLFPCTLCKAGSFASDEYLQKHISNNHSGIEYLCSQCPKSFPNKGGRRMHEQTRHGEKTEKCKECDLMFPTVSKLRQHVKYSHRKVKDKVCDHCGQAFSAKKLLQAHVNRHTNNRPWKCETCNKDFLGRRHLKTHMERHSLAHHCNKCEVQKASLSDLKMHIRKVHDGVKLTCRYGCGVQTWGTGNRGRHERDCELSPIPGAPYSVSTGTASQFILDNYNSSLKNK